MTAEQEGQQPKEIRRVTGPEARVWRKLIKKVLAKKQLSETEQRAVELRETGILISSAVLRILKDHSL